MSDTAELLFANDAFYHAFRSRDLAAMEALWAQHAPIACVHPGWHALNTREDVMESWEGILSNPEAPAVDCRGARGYLLGELGIVVCYEIIRGSVLTATNIFLREDGTWRMVHHHAGPCGTPPPELAEDPPEEPIQ
jgi:ketosteroid isomerase-like protein